MKFYQIGYEGYNSGVFGSRSVLMHKEDFSNDEIMKMVDLFEKRKKDTKIEYSDLEKRIIKEYDDGELAVFLCREFDFEFVETKTIPSMIPF